MRRGDRSVRVIAGRTVLRESVEAALSHAGFTIAAEGRVDLVVVLADGRELRPRDLVGHAGPGITRTLAVVSRKGCAATGADRTVALRDGARALVEAAEGLMGTLTAERHAPLDPAAMPAFRHGGPGPRVYRVPAGRRHAPGEAPVRAPARQPDRRRPSADAS